MAVKYLRENTKRIKAQNGATALTEWSIVKESNGTFVPVADNHKGPILGISPPVDAGAWTEVYQDGVFEISTRSGVNLGLHDKVFVYNSTTVDAGSAGDWSIGEVVDYDPAAGGAARVRLADGQVGAALGDQFIRSNVITTGAPKVVAHYSGTFGTTGTLSGQSVSGISVIRGLALTMLDVTNGTNVLRVTDVSGGTFGLAVRNAAGSLVNADGVVVIGVVYGDR